MEPRPKVRFADSLCRAMYEARACGYSTSERMLRELVRLTAEEMNEFERDEFDKLWPSEVVEKVATFVRTVRANAASQRLYRCEPGWPAGACAYCDREREPHRFVVLSVLRPEQRKPGDESDTGTIVFSADRTGDITSYAPLGGSPRDVFDHEATLRAAGYRVEGGPGETNPCPRCGAQVGRNEPRSATNEDITPCWRCDARLYRYEPVDVTQPWYWAQE